MDILVLILLLVVVFQAGKHWGYYQVIKTLKEVADDQGFDLEKELGIDKVKDEKIPAVHKLQVEKHGETLYLFDVESDGFICQGSSVQELAELAMKHRNVLYAAVKHEDKIFAFKDGISTEVQA